MDSYKITGEKRVGEQFNEIFQKVEHQIKMPSKSRAKTF